MQLLSETGPVVNVVKPTAVYRPVEDHSIYFRKNEREEIDDVCIEEISSSSDDEEEVVIGNFTSDSDTDGPQARNNASTASKH